MRFLFVIVIFFALLSVSVQAKNFKPWDSEVSVGDETVSVRYKSYNNKKKKVAFHHHKKKHKYYRGYFLVKKQKRIHRSHHFNAIQAGASLLVKIYQVVISSQDGPNCRYDPVCSVYARQAIERYGAFWGSIMAGDRLIRCNPYNPPGKNSVPVNLFRKNK